jgi:hypothetical protein
MLMMTINQCAAGNCDDVMAVAMHARHNLWLTDSRPAGSE